MSIYLPCAIYTSCYQRDQFYLNSVVLHLFAKEEKARGCKDPVGSQDHAEVSVLCGRKLGFMYEVAIAGANKNSR